jgi:hypothetical protein
MGVKLDLSPSGKKINRIPSQKFGPKSGGVKTEMEELTFSAAS